MKNTVSTFLSMKQNGERLTEITSYDYTTAKLVEKAGINAILVGDSLGMTMMGYDTTLPVTMEDMIHHSACVVRACENTMVIMDMPFMSYQASVAEAVRNAGRLMKKRADTRSSWRAAQPLLSRFARLQMPVFRCRRISA